MSDKPDPVLPTWLLPVLSWVTSAYFGIGFLSKVGVPPQDALLMGQIHLVLLSLLFLFLPFFTKIKIGEFLELKREVERTKEEMGVFKADIRSSLAMLSTNINTIGNVSNQITVQLPGPNQLREASLEIEANAPQQAIQGPQQNIEARVLALQDKSLALAWTRIEIERLLRKVLSKRISLSPDQPEDVKFLSLPRLFDLFLSENPGFRYLSDAFRYVNQICNAAIHAQRVSEDQATDALALGGQVIAVLRNYLGD